MSKTEREKGIDYIDQIIKEVHRAECNNDTVFRRALLEEKRQLTDIVPLYPEEIRDKRAKGIINYCRDQYKYYKLKRLHSGKEMFARQFNSTRNEIIRRANNKAIKLDKGIVELKDCTDYKGLEEIYAKMPTVW